jgi:Tfp pilus assembly protein PilF
MTKAITYFQQAIQLDQRYALAYSGLADSYYLSGYYGFLSPADAYTLAESAATVAVGIDDNVAAAHTVLALLKIEHQDPAGAESEFERAIMVQPDYSTAHQRYAWFLLRTKRLADRASSEMRRAVELDPLSSINNIALAQMLYLEGRPDESAEYCNKVIEVDSSFAPAHKYLGLDYQQKQVYAESLDQMKLWAAAP